jgi:hypothetical protein
MKFQGHGRRAIFLFPAAIILFLAWFVSNQLLGEKFDASKWKSWEETEFSLSQRWDMGGGLVLSALVAFAMANVAPVTALIFGTPLKWVAIFAPLAVVMFASFSFEPLSVGALQGLFWGFATRLRPASTSPPGAISSSF